MPDYTWVGLRNYWAMLAPRIWQDRLRQPVRLRHRLRAADHGGRPAAGDPDRPARARRRTCCRTIFLYPLAVSFVVTGTVWGWLLNPRIGMQKLVHDLGWQDFRFDWLVRSDMAIYTVILAGVWQAPASPWRCSSPACARWTRICSRPRRSTVPEPGAPICRVVLPTIWPIFIAVLVILLQFAIKTYDLVRGADRRRAGHCLHAADARGLRLHVPAQRTGRGSAAAVMLLLTLVVVLVPYAVFIGCGGDERSAPMPRRAGRDRSTRC